MQNKKKSGIFTYILCDYIAAVIVWAVFFLYRKFIIEEGPEDINQFINDKKFYYGIILIPLLWLIIYFLAGFYTDIYRKSRLYEFAKTFLVVFIGVLLLFFVLLLDDYITNYKDYYQLFFLLLLFQFSVTVAFRIIVLSRAKKQIQSGVVAYRTLIIGSDQRALNLFTEMTHNKKSLGNSFIGYIDANGSNNSDLQNFIPRMGKLSDLPLILQEQVIDEAIIAIETSEHHLLNEIINTLSEKKNLIIKIIPDMYDIMSGSVKMSNVLGAVLIEIYPDLMPRWQRFIKRGIDIFVALSVLIILSPLYIFIALRVYFSSKGKILYTQERIGENGKPFHIYKFRSMYENAEESGPALSSEKDTRITSWGRIMRKWRFDELPQMVNILKGEMSLVGPRPERQFYIDQVVKREPVYKHLQKVKPGLTSWGMVKFGYASNVEQMIERMKYDLLYIENMSLAIDFKIMLYTILIIFQGKGK